MADLKTDYKDDVLNAEVNELRKYQMIQNQDGTVSFLDVTDYLQVGDSFGSADINSITTKLTDGVLDTLEEVEANDQEGQLAGALSVKELKNTLQSAIDTKLPLAGGTLTGKITTQSVVPSSPHTYACGSLASPFFGTYAKAHNILDDNLKNCGQFQIQSTGTTATEGVVGLWLGNSLAKGTDGNSRGQIVMFNTNSNYAYVYANPNMVGNQGMVLASKGGTIPTASVSGTTLNINI